MIIIKNSHIQTSNLISRKQKIINNNLPQNKTKSSSNTKIKLPLNNDKSSSYIDIKLPLNNPKSSSDT
jgi:hypothetical protein